MTSIEALVRYYLDILAHSETASPRFFHSSRSHLGYQEVAQFPPTPDELAEFTRTHAKAEDDARIFAGYPVVAKPWRGKNNSSGFHLIPLFLFEIESDQRTGSAIPEDAYPQINRQALGYLTGTGNESGSAVMEEMLSLTRDMGLGDMEGDVSLPEMIQSLPHLRREWPWQDAPSIPLAQIRAAGIYSRCILFYAGRSTFTRGLEQELNDLRSQNIEGTALAHFVNSHPRDTPPAASPGQFLQIMPLNREQRRAVEAAATNPVTVVTGPPGTGKSQVVSQIIVQAIWRGERVLFASRNNRAVDVVVERLNRLTAYPALFRLGSQDEHARRLQEFLARVLSVAVQPEDTEQYQYFSQSYEGRVTAIQQLRAQREALRDQRNRLDQLSRQVDSWRDTLGPALFAAVNPAVIQELTHQRNTLRTALAQCLREEHTGAAHLLWPLYWPLVRSSRVARGQAALEAFTPWRKWMVHGPTDLLWTVEHAAAIIPVLDALDQVCAGLNQVAAYHQTRQDLRTHRPMEQLVVEELTEYQKLYDDGLRLWGQWLRMLPQRLDGKGRDAMNRFSGMLKLFTNASIDDPAYLSLRREYNTLAKQVNPYLSAWGITSLSLRGRVPFGPAVFDLVVIDEASQCDIASALPLLFRARRAVVIGDPMQLRHISAVSPREDRSLMEQHRITGEPQLAYSVNSLFDLATGAAGMGGVISLREHHRSHGDIIQFSNEFFYENTLRIATRYATLNAPFPDEAPLRWRNVVGKTVRPEGGSAVNREEAQAVVEEVLRFLRAPGWSGSLGVVTPFRAQANHIRELLLEQGVSSERLSNQELVVDTVHRYQGDERDVMVLSTVLSAGVVEHTERFIQNNPNLLNVAITRARANLVVVGDMKRALNLSEQHILRAFAQYALRVATPPEQTPAAIPRSGTTYPPVSRPDLVSRWEHFFYGKLVEAGVSPIPQYAVEQYLLDFAIIDGNRRLAVEVDGEHYHKDWNNELLLRDQLRTTRLHELGWEVLRFWVYHLRDDTDWCVKQVTDWLQG